MTAKHRTGFLGLDTSNYTTSAAVYCPETGEMLQKKHLLPVKEGELGLRQSDAVFHHTRQLPDMLEGVFADYQGDLQAVAASDRPTQVDGSYMPCFLVGTGAARGLSSAMQLPVYTFTHQQGHVAAAAFGAGQLDLLKQEFIAFHVSGGTTDALLVTPDETCVIRCELVAHSLDVKAGQIVDRVGQLLGLPFPAGPTLELLAQNATGVYHPRAVLRDGCCSLSGIENQCRKRLENGEAPEEIALFCLQSLLAAIEGMSLSLLERYPGRPILYAGGVMSNTLLRKALEDRLGGLFSPPAFSSDNAAGIALLAYLQSARGVDTCGLSPSHN